MEKIINLVKLLKGNRNRKKTDRRLYLSRVAPSVTKVTAINGSPQKGQYERRKKKDEKNV